MSYALLFLLFLLPPAGAQQAKIVDQIITLVNNEVITRTDLLWSLALDAKAPDPGNGIGSDILRQKLDVMIDERLIGQEAARIPSAEITRAEVDRKRLEVINTFPSEAVFRQRIEAVGLTAEKLDELLRQRILIDRFVEFRFRTFVLVTGQEIQDYYDKVFSPEMRARGGIPPALDAVLPNGNTVREAIVQKLREDKIPDEIDRFLGLIRQRAEIVTLAEP